MKISVVGPSLENVCFEKIIDLKKILGFKQSALFFFPMIQLKKILQAWMRV